MNQYIFDDNIYYERSKNRQKTKTKRKVSGFMKKTSKRIITTLTAASVVAAMGVAFANEQEQKIVLNGNVIEGAKAITEAETNYIPLRAVCEGLGFTVDWENDSRMITVTKLPIYITCSPDYDGYTFSRTAPMLLGKAPKLIDDTTYVPQEFVEEILKGELEIVENEFRISYGEDNKVSGTVCELIYDGDKLVQIVIGDKDDIDSQTTLNLSEELAKEAIDAGIEVGSLIEAQVSEMATMSIPPQRIPESLTVITGKNTPVISGTVAELIYEDSNLVRIVIGDKEDVYSQVAVNLDKDIAQKAVELGIQEGTNVVVKTSELETMSIPPQRVCLDIAIEEEKTVEITGTVCELIYEDKKLVQIVIGDKDDINAQTVLNLNEELAKKAEELEIKEGTEIVATTTDLETMSLPPQRVLVDIEIAE